MSEQAPCGAQRLDDPDQQGGGNQGDNDKTRDHIHCDIGAPRVRKVFETMQREVVSEGVRYVSLEKGLDERFRLRRVWRPN